MSESGLEPSTSLDSIKSMLESIKVSMVHLEAVVSDMAEMLEYLSVNTSKEETM